MKGYCIILLSFLLSFPMFAQGEKKDDGTSSKDQIMSAKIAFFTTEIGLTSEEAQAFWPIYNKCWEDVRTAHKSTRKSLNALKEMDESGKSSEAEMKKAINKYIADYQYEGNLQEIYLSEFYKILPTAKVAKLYLAEEAFRKKLTEMWRDQQEPKNDGTPPSPSSNKPEVPDCDCE